MINKALLSTLPSDLVLNTGTDVSEEHVSNFRVDISLESPCPPVLQPALIPLQNLPPYTLKTEVTCSCETSEFAYKTTRCHDQDHKNLNNQDRETSKIDLFYSSIFTFLDRGMRRVFTILIFSQRSMVYVGSTLSSLHHVYEDIAVEVSETHSVSIFGYFIWLFNNSISTENTSI
jgi:hypothetical protein